MGLLIDECLPRALKRLLPGHTCRTVQEMAWAGIKIGALLSLAEAEFDALITIDQGTRLSLLILLTSQSFAYFLLIPVCDQPATILCPNAFLNRTSLISMETMSISVIGLRSGPRV